MRTHKKHWGEPLKENEVFLGEREAGRRAGGMTQDVPTIELRLNLPPPECSSKQQQNSKHF
jgi:hypothetical protein